jgi:hypothetical protein
MSILFVHGSIPFSSRRATKARMPNARRAFVGFSHRWQSPVSTCQFGYPGENVLGCVITVTGPELEELDQREGLYPRDGIPRYARIPIRVEVRHEDGSYTLTPAWVYVNCDARVEATNTPRCMVVGRPTNAYVDTITNMLNTVGWRKRSTTVRGGVRQFRRNDFI